MKHPFPLILILFILFINTTLSQVQLPEGFNVQTVGERWVQPTGLAFQEDGTMFVIEKSGLVWLVKDGEKLDTPFLDIQNEVANHGDMGLMGFVLDPNFQLNGYCYVFYVADFHNVVNEGKPDFDPTASSLFRATIARVARFQANTNDYLTADPSTRHILIGETAQTGIPVLHESHVGGDLVFGTDGTLLITTGDASTWKAPYAGNGPPYFEEKVIQGLADGIIRPEEEVGSFRSQLVDNLNGKILRIDPSTGEGISSNPFFDIANPKAPRSLVWSLGLRNPFRAALRKGTGSSDPADGLPGSLYIGDVGEGRWEELNIATLPGENFGWPLYEGIHPIFEYRDQPTFNKDVANPLFNENGCDQEYFYFQELIQQISQGPNIFSNPCDAQRTVADSLSFIHHPPDLAIAHVTVSDGFYTAAFGEDGEVIRLKTTAEDSPIKDNSALITANSSIAIGFYDGKTYPEKYQGKYFHADHVKGWIKMMEVDLNEQIISIEDFFQDTIFIPHASINPADGNIYFIDYKHRVIKKITYNENVPPIAIASANQHYGASPLSVQFTGINSYDPQQDSISFLWDFGDGTTSASINPSHIFESTNTDPKSFPVQLIVTDSKGASTTKEILISINNTPPNVQIASIQDGDVYPMTSTTEYFLDAIVSDKEHTDGELSFAWETSLVHNAHTHPEPIDTNRTTNTLIVPAGCDGENYSYDIQLQVRDAAGLVGMDRVRIYPDCSSNFVNLTNFEATLLDDAVLCSWATSSEFDLDYMEVQRKTTSNSEFETISTLPSKNIHNIATSYNYTDDQPQVGRNIYRLKMVSKSGDLAYSLEDVVFVIEKGEINFFPNPTDRLVEFFFLPEAEDIYVEVYTANGQLVKMTTWSTAEGSLEYILDIGDLPKGLYFFSIQNGMVRKGGKIIKQ